MPADAAPANGARKEAESPAVDVHAHLVPLDAERVQALPGVRVIDNTHLEVDGHPIALERLYRPEAFIQWMDEQGIALGLISIPPPFYRQNLGEEEAAAWVSYLNDGLQAIAGRHPDRLQALFHLPLEHPDLSLQQARARCSGDHGGFAVATGGNHGRNFADPELRPLWQMLNDAGSFVFVHPSLCGDPRLKGFYGENLLGNPYETAVVAAQMVFGGILEGYPRIKFCLAHCGGVVPAVAGRWQQGFDTRRPGIDARRQPPRALLRRLLVDCIAHDLGMITLAEQVFGPEHIVFGSDWPFPMGLLDPREQLRGVPAATRRRIMQCNFAAAVGAALVTGKPQR